MRQGKEALAELKAGTITQIQFPPHLRRKRNGEDGWQAPIPVVLPEQSVSPVIVKSFPEFLPLAEVADSPQHTVDTMLTRILRGDYPAPQYFLSEAWDFEDLEARASLRMGVGAFPLPCGIDIHPSHHHSISFYRSRGMIMITHPAPKSIPTAISLRISPQCRIATRGLLMLLMNGRNASAIKNTPVRRLGPRFRAALSCPGVRSESFGTPLAYRAYCIITSVTRNSKRADLSRLES